MSRVQVIAPWYEYYPILADSLRLQHHEDWELLLIHDGPIRCAWTGEWTRDPRVKLDFTPRRFNDWGHSLRATAVVSDAADFVLHTNGDNYYPPPFLAEMLKAAKGHAGAYCDMITSHHDYNLWPARLECNHIDCGSVLVRADLARETPWTSRRFAADWFWIAALLEKTRDFVHVPLPLHIHN